MSFPYGRGYGLHYRPCNSREVPPYNRLQFRNEISRVVGLGLGMGDSRLHLSPHGRQVEIELVLRDERGECPELSHRVDQDENLVMVLNWRIRDQALEDCVLHGT